MTLKGQSLTPTDHRWLMLAAMAVLTVGLLLGIKMLGVQWEASKEAMGKMPRRVDVPREQCEACSGGSGCACCQCPKSRK